MKNLALILTLASFSTGLIAHAQEAAPEASARVIELEKTVEQLQQRLERLEKMQPAQQKPAPDLGLRLNALEEKVAKIDGPDALRVTWRNGLTFQSADQAFNLQLGGRIQADAAYFVRADEGLDEVASEPIKDGTEFRRTRLELGGTIYQRGEFKIQYDFAEGTPGFRYVYFGLRDVPGLGTLRVGHMQEPFGLEQLTSSKYMTFLERGLTTTFAPSYNMGAMFFADIEERATYSAGLFRETDDFAKSKSSDGYHFTGRLTALPVDENNGRTLVHLGAAGSYQTTPEDEVRFRTRPESHLAPYFVDTGTLPVEDLALYGLEAATVFGPLSLQGEYMLASTQGTESDAEFSSYYGMVSWFLTGENRPYLRKEGLFGRVKPNGNFRSAEGGIGAWELALRMSGIDLNDGDVAGGKMQDLSGALNWYLNPNMRVMLDYILADVNDAGDAQIVTTRFQVDF